MHIFRTRIRVFRFRRKNYSELRITGKKEIRKIFSQENLKRFSTKMCENANIYVQFAFIRFCQRSKDPGAK